MDIDDNVEAESELIKEALVISHHFVISDFQAARYKLLDCKCFSPLHKRLRTSYSLCNSFCQDASHQEWSPWTCNEARWNFIFLPPIEINEAKEHWIKGIQGKSFVAGIKSLTTNKLVGIPVHIKQFGLACSLNKEF